MNISLAITTFNRFDLTIKSCAQVLNDPRIDDIVILDDCSMDGSFEKLIEHFKPWPHVRVLRQAKNRGMSINKKDAISYARNQWVIILDSDNVIAKEYIDAIGDPKYLFPSYIYCPEFARPRFDYRKFSGGNFNLQRHWHWINDDTFLMCLNTCNYLVNRDEYIAVYKHNPDMKATDTLWFNYLWIKSGRSLIVKPGMQYDHLVHDRSGFLEDANYNMAQADKLKKMMMAL